MAREPLVTRQCATPYVKPAPSTCAENRADGHAPNRLPSHSPIARRPRSKSAKGDGSAVAPTTNNAEASAGALDSQASPNPVSHELNAASCDEAAGLMGVTA